jgi:hypothetical protein
MDNRNAAIKFEAIDARDLTDTHRRCLCTAAAAQFGLAWQLWAKEPVENPHRDEPSAAAKPAANPTAARQAAPTRQAPTRQAPAKPQQQAASDTPAATLATAIKRCQEAGLTPPGMNAMAKELSNGDAYVIGQLPIEILRKLAAAGVSTPSVKKWNAAGAALTDDDPDLPRNWDAPAAA